MAARRPVVRRSDHPRRATRGVHAAAAGRAGGSRRGARVCTRTFGGGLGTLQRFGGARVAGACLHLSCRPCRLGARRGGRRPPGRSDSASARPSRHPGLRPVDTALGHAATGSNSCSRVRLCDGGRRFDRRVDCLSGYVRTRVHAPRRGRGLGACGTGRMCCIRDDRPAATARRPDHPQRPAQRRHRIAARCVGCSPGCRLPHEPLAGAVRSRAAAAPSTVVRDSAARASGDARLQDWPLQCPPLRARSGTRAGTGEARAYAADRPARRPRPAQRDQQRSRPSGRGCRPSRRWRRPPRAIALAGRPSAVWGGRVRRAAAGHESQRGTGDRRASAERDGSRPVPQRDRRERPPGDYLHRRRLLSGARFHAGEADPPGRSRRVPRQAPGEEPRAGRERRIRSRARFATLGVAPTRRRKAQERRAARCETSRPTPGCCRRPGRAGHGGLRPWSARWLSPRSPCSA